MALSGGVDSVVLLHALSRLARRRRFGLSAIHVNHQISPNAKQWAAFCRRLCRARGVGLTVVEVAVPRGNSLEAAARAARYAAFRALPAEYVVLAHNQDDQAETLLLQLLRGAGAKGLAAMPLVRKDEGRGRRDESGEMRARAGARRKDRPSSLIPHPCILRPLLDVPRTEILKYARGHRLRWIEDESNLNTDFARNFLRHEILPRVSERFPAYRDTLGRSARHLGEAAALLDELAMADGAQKILNGTLEVAALARLSGPRARNLLRWFLAGHSLAMPGAERLAEAVRQAVAARSDARVCVDLGAVELRRFAGALHVVPKVAAGPEAFARRWRGERRLVLPGLAGVLTMTKSRGQGISSARLDSQPVTIRPRQGGERLRPDCRRPRRSLKNLLQESRIPPWQRDRLPLLFCGGDLVWAPGIGVACEYQAKGGEASIVPAWSAAVLAG